MFERLRASLGLQFARLQFRTDFDVAQPLTDFFQKAHNVLIVLPIGYEDAVIASDILNQACRRVPDIHLTIVHSGTRETSLAAFTKSEVIRVHADDLNKFFLPTQRLLHQIIKRQYDVAINLNLDFVLHTAYICKASRARVRVGCPHAAADVFYNVQFNVKMDQPAQARYQQFGAFVKMF